jgi:hypothetical protein
MDGQVRLATVLNIAVAVLLLLLGGIFGRIRKRKNLAGRTFSGHTDLMPPALAGNSISEEAEERLTWLYLALLITSIPAVILTRAASLFSVYLCLYIPNFISRMKNKDERFVLTVITVILFTLYLWVKHIFRTPEWQTTYPFSFFWEYSI